MGIYYQTLDGKLNDIENDNNLFVFDGCVSGRIARTEFSNISEAFKTIITSGNTTNITSVNMDLNELYLIGACNEIIDSGIDKIKSTLFLQQEFSLLKEYAKQKLAYNNKSTTEDAINTEVNRIIKSYINATPSHGLNPLLSSPWLYYNLMVNESRNYLCGSMFEVNTILKLYANEYQNSITGYGTIGRYFGGGKASKGFKAQTAGSSGNSDILEFDNFNTATDFILFTNVVKGYYIVKTGYFVFKTSPTFNPKGF